MDYKKKRNSKISKLYSSHSRGMKCYSYHFLHNWDTAEDITQNLFLELCESSREIKDNDRYYYKCLRFKSIDYLREKKSYDINLDYIDEISADDIAFDNPEDIVIEGEVIDTVNEVLQLYPEKYLDIFYRSEYLGQKATTISKETSTTIYSVKKIVSEIKRTIQDTVTKKYDVEH